MSFEPIGPYRLSRTDAIIAAYVICLAIGPMKVAWSIILIVLFAAVTYLTNSWIGGLAGVAVVLASFAVQPALACQNTIRLSEASDGLSIETEKMRAVLKWTAIRESKRVGSRLFIMISPKAALTIPKRATSPENMNLLVATLAQNRV